MNTSGIQTTASRKRKRPYLVDELPVTRWIATCAICGVSRVFTHEQIADGSWIACPSCEEIDAGDYEEARAA